MNKAECVDILIKNLSFAPSGIKKIELYVDLILKFNKKYNIISKNTEKDVWNRHILDSAQIVRFIDFSIDGSLSDLGSGAGFPGIILSIFNTNKNFHVKLYEKSKIKCNFLRETISKLDLNAKVLESDINKERIKSNYFVCRAFKKLDKLMLISREIAIKPYKMIVLKGKNAQDDVNKALKKVSFKYKIESSITDKESKILLIDES